MTAAYTSVFIRIESRALINVFTKQKFRLGCKKSVWRGITLRYYVTNFS